MKPARLLIAAGCVASVFVAVELARMPRSGFDGDPIDAFLHSISSAWREKTPVDGCGGIGAIGADFAGLKTQVMMFEAISGRLPTNAEGLAVLVSRPADGTLSRWRQLMPELPTDRWRRPYQYRAPALKSAERFEIFSLGPDGVISGDDIGTW